MENFPSARRVRLPDRGVTLSVHEAGRGPAVVLCHGFPELAYSWRHQVRALADAGFRVIALDQRGFGACGHWTQQEKPEELSRLMIDWLRRRFGAAKK